MKEIFNYNCTNLYYFSYERMFYQKFCETLVSFNITVYESLHIVFIKVNPHLGFRSKFNIKLIKEAALLFKQLQTNSNNLIFS